MTPSDSVDVRDSRTPSPGTSISGTSQRATGGHWWIWLLVIVLAGGGYWYFRGRSAQATATVAGGKGPGPGGANAPGNFVVPVVAATATRGDLPVFFNGLGNVTAFNTVTVRSRVDGELVKVSYEEGQTIKQGDPLV